MEIIGKRNRAGTVGAPCRGYIERDTRGSARLFASVSQSIASHLGWEIGKTRVVLARNGGGLFLTEDAELGLLLSIPAQKPTRGHVSITKIPVEKTPLENTEAKKIRFTGQIRDNMVELSFEKRKGGAPRE